MDEGAAMYFWMMNGRDPNKRARCVCVCFITAGPITKLFAWGGRRVEDMCYERRRAEAYVD